MQKHKRDLTFEKLEKKIQYLNEEELDVVKKAYEFARKKHFGQLRLTGEEYIIHPLNVAYILTSINADFETLSAALLHDVAEDCGVKISEIEKSFGKSIALLVDGVTKISKLKFSNDSEITVNNQRKILVGLSEDVRVIIVKLADRLNNMQTLYVHSPKKQKKISRETLDILTPIAGRLGMNSIKQELEEYCLRYLNPDEYYGIVEKLNATKAERDLSVAKMIESVSELLNKHGIKHKIKGRSKSIYSIYKKLQKGKRFCDIYDLLALRIYVNTESECYGALGIIHSKYRPKPKRFKDYIAMPKTNMYQSLHTTVFGIDGQLFEIQIRTFEMDRVAEYGIASHWSYKEKGSVKALMQNEMEQKLQFFRSIMDLRMAEESDEIFVNSVKEEVFRNTIYVFTPLGDVIELPNGSTPVDFAYKVHTNVGNRTAGAIVNAHIVPLDYKLRNEDIVKIITSNSTPGPNREWLNFVQTTQAKTKIKNYFNKVNREENTKKGEDILYREIKKHKIDVKEFFTDDNIKKILNGLKTKSLDEVYASIGSGKTSVDSVFSCYEDKENKIIEKAISKVKADTKQVVSIAGMDDIKVNIAKCCKPVIGDRIVGYITRGYGVSVHRMVCPNVSDGDERVIDVKWNNSLKKLPSTILIRVEKSKNIIIDIVSKANNCSIPIKRFSTAYSKEEDIIKMTILVDGKDNLIKFMNDIKMIDEVIDVERVIE